MVYTTLDSDPTSQSSESARVYAQLTANLTATLLAPAARPVLPVGTILNVNYGTTTFSSSGAPNGDCTAAGDFSWVFTRLVSNSSARDVQKIADAPVTARRRRQKRSTSWPRVSAVS